MIYRIRINELMSNLSERQVLSTRIEGTDDDVAHKADELLTTWLHLNPGRCASWVMSGLSGRELGH